MLRTVIFHVLLFCSVKSGNGLLLLAIGLDRSPPDIAYSGFPSSFPIPPPSLDLPEIHGIKISQKNLMA